MQRARRLAVDVLLVLLDDDAQLGEIEMGVQRLHRIEGPLDEIETHRQRAIALHQLQTVADAVSSVVLNDAEHVRPLRRPPFSDAGQRVHKADHPLAVERADQDAAAFDADRENRDGYDVIVPRPPDLALELDDRRELDARRQVAVGDRQLDYPITRFGNSVSERMTGMPRRASSLCIG